MLPCVSALNDLTRQAAEMSQDIDERVHGLLQYITWAIPDATLEYEHMAGTHRFVINRLQLNYWLSFPERVVQKASFEDLKAAIAPAIDRILLGASPRRVWVCCWQAAGTA
jgi:hypothetical protein